MIIHDLFESPQLCPECGGISFSDLILAEKKDACYYKVKASAKVWPSAYASGRLVQCRKKGADSYGNKSESVIEAEDSKCPPATQDITLNLKNRQKAIDEYGYGPLNPDMPNQKFWMAKVEEWNLDSPEEAQQSLCGNCAAFDQREDTLDCIAQGIGSDQGADDPTIDAGDLGYCRFLKFKCASRRTCDAWVSGGPLADDQNVAEDQLGEKWSQKYKSSINCSNPKGFSQKAHCAGKNESVAEGLDTEELANEVYAEFERTYPNLARRADERTVHAAIMDVLNYGGDSNPSALAQDVARAVKQEMQQGVAEGVSLKQKHEDKKRADQNQVRYGKMTQAEFDKKYTRTERPKPTDKEPNFDTKDDEEENQWWIDHDMKEGVAEGQPQEKEADYGADYQDMVARVKKLAGLGPLKTVWDPAKRVYRNIPTAVQPKK